MELFSEKSAITLMEKIHLSLYFYITSVLYVFLKLTLFWFQRLLKGRKAAIMNKEHLLMRQERRNQNVRLQQYKEV